MSAALPSCGDDPPVAAPTLLGERETFAGSIQLTLTVGAGRTELRGRLQWDREPGKAVWESDDGGRRLVLQRGADGAAQARLEVDGAAVPLDARGQQELFALAALLYQTPRASAAVTALGGGTEGYLVRERDRALEVRFGDGE